RCDQRAAVGSTPAGETVGPWTVRWERNIHRPSRFAYTRSNQIEFSCPGLPDLFLGTNRLTYRPYVIATSPCISILTPSRSWTAYSLSATRLRNAALSSSIKAFPPVVQPSPWTKEKSSDNTL